jgi:hypothetical protein
MSVQLDPSQGFPNLYDTINKRFSDFNPMVIFTLLILLVFYYIVFSSLGASAKSSVDMTSSVYQSSGMGVMELLMWGILVFLILINGLQYFFSLDINAAIKNIFSPIPEIDITVDQKDTHLEPVPEIMFEKQVFNVPGNDYSYDDAKALCKAYDARLATYEEIESAYNNGAEWCGYGWSKDQLALFPTQKSTYDKLQKIKGHENDCGRPGINGGYINNKNVRFGVNCFGYKPEITQEEQSLLHETPHYPITEKDKEMERKVNEYRKNLPKILVAPFNKGRWSQI